MSALQDFIAAAAARPDVTWWLEEVSIRGTPEGKVAGAHAIIKASLTDPVAGKMTVERGPFPLLDIANELSGEAADDWAMVLGAIVPAQQATIDTLMAERNALQSDFDARGITVNAQAATIAQQAMTITTLQSEVETQAATIAGLEAQLAAQTPAE